MEPVPSRRKRNLLLAAAALSTALPLAQCGPDVTGDPHIECGYEGGHAIDAGLVTTDAGYDAAADVMGLIDVPSYDDHPVIDAGLATTDSGYDGAPRDP